MSPLENAPRPIPGRGAAWKIALIYALISASWIFGSDLLLREILSQANAQRLTKFQTAKGLFFVLTTAGLIFFMIRDALQRIWTSQKALQASEDHFRRMVEWSPVGIFIDVDGRFEYVNHAMLVLLGANSPRQLLGRFVLDFIHPDYHPTVKQRIRVLREQKQAVPLIEERYRRLDGAYVWVEVTAIPIEYEGKAASQVMVRDVHARKLAESQLRQLNDNLERRVTERTAELQRANEDLKTFSYTLSHDLRVPVRNIGRFGEQLLHSGANAADPDTSESARRIVAAAARLERLIQDLFDYNRFARNQIRLRRVSLILLVNEIAGQLRREPEFANVQVDVREPMPWVLAHRPTLALVVQNLVYNAAKFVSPVAKPLVTISARPIDGMARLTIEDNGIGIEPDRAQTIFDIFDQPGEDLEGGGGGLGLAIVRRGVERMGGRVGVDSIAGAGSRFWIELPLDPESP